MVHWGGRSLPEGLVEFTDRSEIGGARQARSLRARRHAEADKIAADIAVDECLSTDHTVCAYPDPLQDTGANSDVAEAADGDVPTSRNAWPRGREIMKLIVMIDDAARVDQNMAAQPATAVDDRPSDHNGARTDLDAWRYDCRAVDQRCPG